MTETISRSSTTPTYVPDSFTGSNRILAVRPTEKGFSFAVFEGPDSPLDWGCLQKTEKENSLDSLVMKLHALCDYYSPTVLVSERIPDDAHRSELSKELSKEIPLFAKEQSLESKQFDRHEVKGVFSVFGAVTQQNIAELIADWLPGYFVHYLPKKTKSWETTHPRIYLFYAIALALSYYYIRD
ncbi:MAG: hypothetical protein AAF465_10025 [Pseudomonadota bacterium]